MCFYFLTKINYKLIFNFWKDNN